MAEEQDELGGVEDADLDAAAAEAGDDEDDGFEQDLNDYSKVDRSRVDDETKKFLQVSEPDVNVIEFEELRSDQVGQLSEERFGEYLAFRENGGIAPLDSEESEDDIPLSIPDWASEELLPDKEWQKRLAGMYGTAQGDGDFAGEGRLGS